MAIQIFRCMECSWSGKSFREVTQCPNCNTNNVKVDIVGSCKSVNMDRVPGGYNSNVLETFRRSEEGQAQEIEYLLGNTNASY